MEDRVDRGDRVDDGSVSLSILCYAMRAASSRYAGGCVGAVPARSADAALAFDVGAVGDRFRGGHAPAYPTVGGIGYRGDQHRLES